MERRLRELPLALGIVERVLAVPEERLVRVRAGAVDPEDRLRHEGREEAVAVGSVAHDEAEGGEIVRRLQRLRVAEIDSVLARGPLVVPGLYLKPHRQEVFD